MARYGLLRRRIVRAAGFALLAAAAGAAALAQQETTPPNAAPVGSEAERLGYTSVNNRMTVAVDIDGQGPFRFLVDTGAERTIISRQLANSLQLSPGRVATLHSMTEVSDVSTVVIPELQLGSKQVNDIHAPALEQGHIGAQGMIGVDSLQSQRVLFDFKKREMTISPARRVQDTWPDGSIVVRARNHMGRLVLVDAEVDGSRVAAILDTGSQVTIGNSALRRKLEQRGRFRPGPLIDLVSVTGGRLSAEGMLVPRMRIGGVEVREMPIAFADIHAFRKLNLTDRPAIMLGMDALQLFDRVSVDFANRRVRLLPPGDPGGQWLKAGEPARLAALAMRRPPAQQ